MYLSLPQIQDCLLHPVPIHLQNQLPRRPISVSITLARNCLQISKSMHKRKRSKEVWSAFIKALPQRW